jgi:hypothetical protein
VPEAAQAGQEQLAGNIALQREGFDVPTFRGVAGQLHWKDCLVVDSVLVLKQLGV